LIKGKAIFSGSTLTGINRQVENGLYVMGPQGCQVKRAGNKIQGPPDENPFFPVDKLATSEAGSAHWWR